MHGHRVLQAIGSWFEPASLFLVTALSVAVILADADRRLLPGLRLDTFENQAAALWSVDQPLPDMPSAKVVTRVLSEHPPLP